MGGKLPGVDQPLWLKGDTTGATGLSEEFAARARYVFCFCGQYPGLPGPGHSYSEPRVWVRTRCVFAAPKLMTLPANTLPRRREVLSSPHEIVPRVHRGLYQVVTLMLHRARDIIL